MCCHRLVLNNVTDTGDTDRYNSRSVEPLYSPSYKTITVSECFNKLYIIDHIKKHNRRAVIASGYLRTNSVWPTYNPYTHKRANLNNLKIDTEKFKESYYYNVIPCIFPFTIILLYDKELFTSHLHYVSFLHHPKMTIFQPLSQILQANKNPGST
jgi:hypothetical protein